jgi:hypothetical protein
MKSVVLEMPDTFAQLVANLDSRDKERLSSFVQLWLASFAKGEKNSANEILKKIQLEIAQQELSEEEIEQMIRESVT